MVVLLAGAVPAQAELYKDVARGLALLDFQFSGQRCWATVSPLTPTHFMMV